MTIWPSVNGMLTIWPPTWGLTVTVASGVTVPSSLSVMSMLPLVAAATPTACAPPAPKRDEWLDELAV